MSKALERLAARAFVNGPSGVTEEGAGSLRVSEADLADALFHWSDEVLVADGESYEYRTLISAAQALRTAHSRMVAW